jgi:alpha-tubulin suppressor-like RCC1 family protein
MPSNFRVAGIDTDDIFIRRELFMEGGLWLWGRNTGAQLGTNDLVNRSSPVQTVSRGLNWFQVTATRGDSGIVNTAAIKTDGTLWIWGQNNYGQVGDNTILAARSSPVQTIAGGTNWRQVAAGRDSSLCIKTDGSLWTWGKNNNGQLGDNTVINRSSPAQVLGGGTNWKQVSAGGHSTSAIKTDGTLWTWGRNANGQLGDNTVINRSSPVQIAGTNWRQTSCGINMTAAIKTDGTLWMWGGNSYAQLGVNDQASRSSPVQIFGGGTNWKQASSGNFTSAAIKTDGTLWIWGQNFFGSLGTNDQASRSSPVQIFGGGTNWKQVSVGLGFHAMAIKTDGTLWIWGQNDNGRLGTNDQVVRSSPIQIFGGGTNWRQVSAGYQHGVGIREDYY